MGGRGGIDLRVRTEPSAVTSLRVITATLSYVLQRSSSDKMTSYAVDADELEENLERSSEAVARARSTASGAAASAASATSAAKAASTATAGSLEDQGSYV